MSHYGKLHHPHQKQSEDLRRLNVFIFWVKVEQRSYANTLAKLSVYIQLPIPYENTNDLNTATDATPTLCPRKQKALNKENGELSGFEIQYSSWLS